MDFIAELWLPILLASVAVWIAAAVIWMVMPLHRSDYIKLPDENGFIAAVKSMGLKPGNYGFPNACDSAARKDPEMQRKWKEGPVGFLTVMNGCGSMGKNMLLSFLVYVAASVVIAYLTSVALPWGTPFMKVFQVAGTAGVLGYCFAMIPHQIWFGAYARTIVAHIVDGLIYGLGTGAIFAAMWPKA
jgi:hypothetical protein